MAFDDRLQFLLLGLAIGTVFGYLIRLLQDVKTDVTEVKHEVHDVKEELDEVDSMVKEMKNHDERGFLKLSFTKLALALIVGLTAYAAFLSQQASNNVENSVDRNEIVTYCNLTVTSKALTALNERSTFTLGNTQANIDLQKDFADFLNILLHQPPFDEDKRREAAEEYQASQNNFVNLAEKTRTKVIENPFPEVEDLVACIEEGEVPGNNLELYLDKEELKGEQ